MAKKCICVPIWGLFLAFTITVLVQMAGISSGSFPGSHASQVSSNSR